MQRNILYSTRIELEREPLYLVVPETLLRTYYGDKTNALLMKAYQEGIDLASLPGIPLVLGHSASYDDSRLKFSDAKAYCCLPAYSGQQLQHYD